MKKKMFYTVDCIVIAVLVLLIVMDTFVISRTYVRAEERSWTEAAQTAEDQTGLIEAEEPAKTDQAEQAASAKKTEGSEPSEISADPKEEMIVYEEDDQEVFSEPVTTDRSYTDENISVSIEEYRYNDTTVYVADVQVSSAEYLYAALAQNSYGKNIKSTTSDMAEENNAILAVNGDYYGARNAGYVLRNGTLYRAESASSDQEDLVIGYDGSLSVIKEGETAAGSLNAWQIYSFGPALIENGQICVGLDEEVGKAMASNPRTAICEIEPLHYLFVVSDGRTEESEGLSLYELAEFLQSFGVSTAYNLDGGGSSTMVFMGEVVNNPTTSGKSSKERSVSDAVCIGY